MTESIFSFSKTDTKKSQSRISPSYRGKSFPVIVFKRFNTSGELLEKLSTITTSNPALSNSITVCEPIYPAPPVTKIAIFASSLSSTHLLRDLFVMLKYVDHLL